MNTNLQKWAKIIDINVRYNQWSMVFVNGDLENDIDTKIKLAKICLILGPSTHHREAKFGTSTTWQRRARARSRNARSHFARRKQTNKRSCVTHADPRNSTELPQRTVQYTSQALQLLNCYSRIFSYENNLKLYLNRYFRW